VRARPNPPGAAAQRSAGPTMPNRLAAQIPPAGAVHGAGLVSAQRALGVDASLALGLRDALRLGRHAPYPPPKPHRSPRQPGRAPPSNLAPHLLLSLTAGAVLGCAQTQRVRGSRLG
jgi:hypothetical protein